MYFRSDIMQERYDAHRRAGHLIDRCPLCEEEAIETFVHWRLIDNAFPYDRISEVHHMLVPHAHVKEDGLSEEARAELIELKKGYLNERYFYILEALPQRRSIPEHMHLHLIIPKPF